MTTVTAWTRRGRPVLTLVLLAALVAPATTLQTSNRDACASAEGIVREAVPVLQKGEVFELPGFISTALVDELRRDAYELRAQSHFKPSGLTNTAVRGQDFNPQDDRSLCPLEFRDHFERLAEAGPVGNVAARKKLGQQVEELRLALASAMARPTMADDDLDHEVGFSIYGPGAKLDRHLDEHHEETKGAKGWTQRSRRSISWLVYLNDDAWSVQRDGGALRSLALPLAPSSAAVGAHEMNLQVGWLADDQEPGQGAFEPVFLDCWHGGQALSVLFTIQPDRSRQLISRPFDSSNSNLRAHLRATLLDDQVDRTRFFPLEDRALWEQGDIKPYNGFTDVAPRGGTLVLFDSVAVPHEVTPCTRDRLSIAGWMHEAQQPFPEMLA